MQKAESRTYESKSDSGQIWFKEWIKMKIEKTFYIDAAHSLPHYQGKCKQLHGHTWTLKISIDGEPDKLTGMILDFSDLKYIVETQVISKLDHTYLNDTVENPTCENISIWIKEQLSRKINRPFNITLWEGLSGSRVNL